MLRQVELSVGRPPDPSWKRPPGRPRTKWTDQLRRDTNNVPIATLWRQAIGRGPRSLESDATVRADYALTTTTTTTSGGITYGSDALEGGLVDVGKDVGLRVAEYLEGDGTVVILQRRYVVVADGQVGARVDLITDNKPSHICLTLIHLGDFPSNPKSSGINNFVPLFV